ncbi:MAG: polyprenol monophosphomannose synthase [Candidatus Planktophila sp.]|nr:polyprenol monophosphomannose synthase [Candidatus Planktophila sp.]
MNSSIVVIPTYNEVESIPSLLDALKVLPLDILVIDDGSPDGTAKVCIAHGVEVISRSGKMGLGSAYRTGFAIALDRGYSNVIEMDADGSHQVSDLVRMMEWIGTSDLLIGSRWVADGAIENWSKFREYLSKGANAYANALLSLGIADTTSGFRIYSAELLKKMDIATIKSEGYCFQIEMTRRAIARGGSLGEIPITFIERTHGMSKMSFLIALEAILRITSWGLLRLIGR